MHYVYVIESLSAQGERYIGRMTTDLKQRLRAHNEGKSFHSTKFSPWKLVTYIAFTDRAKAEAFERYLNPVQVMHSLESAYSNWPLKVFHVSICSRLQANGALLQGRHSLGNDQR